MRGQTARDFLQARSGDYTCPDSLHSWESEWEDDGQIIEVCRRCLVIRSRPAFKFEEERKRIKVESEEI